MAQAVSRTFKLALCQILVGKDKTQNLRHASEYISKAVQKGAHIVVLPEIFNSPYSNASFPIYCEPIPRNKKEIDPNKMPSSYMLSQAALKHSIYLIGGKIPEIDYYQNNKLFNTSLIFNTQGEIIAKYRKMHLFDINIPNKIRFMESEILSSGNDIICFECNINNNNIKIGMGICYDLRFPELADIYRQEQCHMIIYPGAFNTTTGPLHWELLLRSRALDNQLFVVGCSPAFNPNLDYPVYGHSTIVDPWGKIIGTTKEKEDIIISEVNLDEINTIRQQIPILKQKRKDLYKSASINKL